MTNKDLLIGFGGIDADLVLAAAPSDKFCKVKNEKADAPKPKFHNKTIWLKIGALAAALILLVCSVPMLLELLPSGDPVIDDYNEVITQCDLAVFGTYKGKTESLTYSEYTFEVTEVLKGEITQTEITVRSEKKTIFSDDEMEKYAKSVNSSFKTGNEYYLTLQSSADEIVTFISEQIIDVADLGNIDTLSDGLTAFFESYGVTVNTTREELIEFFKYIFSGIEAEENEPPATEGLVYKLSEDAYHVTGYKGESSYVNVPSEYNGIPVTCIAPEAFINNSVIKSVRLPDSIKSIDSSAFRSCKNLASINIPPRVNTIYSHTFENCIRLVNVDIQGSLQMIYGAAFYKCHKLKSINLPDGLEVIAYRAFEECKSLTELHIPASTTTISVPDAFQYCENLSSITVDKNNPVYHSSGNCIINTETKTLILGCQNSVIPADGSVTSIGYGAFAGAKYLTEIDIPACVERIEISAFLACRSLKKVTLNEGLKFIDADAFSECGITNIEIPNSLTGIGNSNPFYGCPIEYNIHNDVLYLGNRSNPYMILIKFDGSLSTETVMLPSTVKLIAAEAFYESRISEIYLPDGLIEIGSLAFSTPTLAKIRIPDSVTSIKWNSFQGCPTTMLYNMYEGGAYLGNENNPYLVLMKAKDTNIKEAVIHEQTKLIIPYTFSDCTYLEKVTIPDNVETIEYEMFKNTAIAEITLPYTVKRIKGAAFQGCKNLKTINYTGTTEQWKAVEKDDYWSDTLKEFKIVCVDGVILDP